MKTRWLLLCLFSAVGCGVAIDNVSTESAKTVCKKIYECCNAGEVATNSMYGPNEEKCRSNVGTQLNQATQVKAGVDKGRLVYNSDRFAECLKQYASLTCEQLKSTATSSTPACDAYLDPKVQVGSPCGFDGECIGGTCVGGSSGADGVCAAFVGENGGCNDGGTCGAGLFCEGSGTCKPRRSDGAACSTNYECATGGCNGRDAGVSGTCGLKGGAGTTCYATEGCSISGGAVSLLGLALALVMLVRRHAR